VKFAKGYNQLKNIKKERSLARRKNIFEKKFFTGFCQVTRVTGRPGRSTEFDRFFLLSVFHLTQTDSATGSTGLACQASSGLIIIPDMTWLT
jgi:hypothetical protein